MAFLIDNDNPIRNLLELHCRTVEANHPDAVDVHATLMVQPDEIDVGEHVVEIRIRALRICVEAHGCETDPNSKYGIRKNLAIERRDKKTESTVKTSVSSTVAAKAMVAGKFDGVKVALDASIEASGSAENSREVSLTETEETSVIHMVVEAVGGDQWKVSASSNEPLRGQYISDDRLCRLLRKAWPSNRFGATVTVEVKKRDIDVAVLQSSQRSFFGSPNKEKILGLLMANSLSDQRHDPVGGTITFATSEINDAG